MGTPKGPCGSLVKRLPYLPLKPYTTGQYDYFFSHLKTFSKQTYFYRTGVTIYTTFG
jgi:hypothetical protein